MCLRTRGEFVKKEEQLNLEESGSRSSLDSKESPGTRMAAWPHDAECILKENGASLRDTLVQRGTLKMFT